jgi:beta-lactamase superfamily II metal-dependent hydrolase
MSVASPSAPTGLSIQILDVGQGDGIYIEFPNGKNMLVDLGSTKPSKGYKVASTDALAYLGGEGRFAHPGRTLDFLVVTHADSDHYNLLPTFISTYKPDIRYLLHAGTPEDYKSDFRKWLDLVVQANQSVPVASGYPTLITPPKRTPFPLNLTTQVAAEILAQPGATDTEVEVDNGFGGVEVVIMAINTVGTSKTDHGWMTNTTSIVLWLRYAGRTVMLSGDATIDTENAVMRAVKGMTKRKSPDDDEPATQPVTQLRTDVLKVGHHGSARTSSQPDWIQWMKPEFVFISSDRHGSLDEDLKTQYRLPQELTIDIIRANTQLAAASEHGYVSSYDPEDYTGYRVPGSGTTGFPLDASRKPGLWKAEGKDAPGRQWYQAVTTEAVFSTLGVMDMKSPEDGSEADQGVQYAIAISSEGALTIYSTLDPDQPAAAKTPS